MYSWNFELNVSESHSLKKANKNLAPASVLVLCKGHYPVAQERTQVTVTLLLIPPSNQSTILSIIIFKLCVSPISSLLSKPSATTLDPSHHHLCRQQKLLTAWSLHIQFGQFSPISSPLNSHSDVFHIFLYM